MRQRFSRTGKAHNTFNKLKPNPSQFKHIYVWYVSEYNPFSLLIRNINVYVEESGPDWMGFFCVSSYLDNVICDGLHIESQEANLMKKINGGAKDS